MYVRQFAMSSVHLIYFTVFMRKVDHWIDLLIQWVQKPTSVLKVKLLRKHSKFYGDNIVILYLLSADLFGLLFRHFPNTFIRIRYYPTRVQKIKHWLQKNIQIILKMQVYLDMRYWIQVGLEQFWFCNYRGKSFFFH